MSSAFAHGACRIRTRQRQPTARSLTARHTICRSLYPRVDPAIIVLPVCGEFCLLGHNARWKDGRFSALAGFAELGESLEGACCREVAEESGVQVRYVNCRAFLCAHLPALPPGAQCTEHASHTKLVTTQCLISKARGIGRVRRAMRHCVHAAGAATA